MNDTNTITTDDVRIRETQPEIVVPPDVTPPDATPTKRAAIAWITREVGDEVYHLAIYNWKHKAWGFPGGKFEAEKDADLLHTVNRELLEETGLVAASAVNVYAAQTYVRTKSFEGGCTPVERQDDTLVTVFKVTAHGVPVALEPNQAVGWVTMGFLMNQANHHAGEWFVGFFQDMYSYEDDDSDCDEDAYEDTEY